MLSAMGFLGLKIIENQHMPVEHKWIFPKDRFVEYGPEDEWWAKKVGFGHDKLIHKAWQIGDSVMMHPDMAAQLRKEIDRRNKQITAPMPTSVICFTV